MKRVLSMLVCLAVLTVAGSAFAKGFNGRSNNPLQIRYQQSKDNGRIQTMNRLKIQVKTVQNNEAEIRRLKTKTAQKVGEIKALIGPLKQDQSRLGPEKLKAIKTSLGRIREAQRALESTRGTIRSKELLLRSHRNKKDLDGFLKNLDGIVSVQEERIRLLRETLDRLEELKNSLV